MTSPEWIGKNPINDDVDNQFVYHDCTDEALKFGLETRRILFANGAFAEITPLEKWPDVPCSYIVGGEDRTTTLAGHAEFPASF